MCDILLSMTQKAKAKEILKRLRKAYPKRGPFVLYSNPLELVMGTVLSAQCTDERVNMVTKDLFKKYKTAKDYAHADIKQLEKEIYSTGFYKNKAKFLKSIGEILLEKHNGKVPATLDELLELPGVSHKTAYLVLAKAFNTYEGVAVDTHVKRLTPRLGLTRETKNTDIISKDLEKVLDKKDYLDINEYFIMHGRAVCVSKPKCSECVLIDLCPYGKTQQQ